MVLSEESLNYDLTVNDFKGAVSSIFSITVKSQKTQFSLWKPKNNGPVVLK